MELYIIVAVKVYAALGGNVITEFKTEYKHSIRDYFFHRTLYISLNLHLRYLYYRIIHIITIIMIALIQSQEADKTAKYLKKAIELLEPETIHFFFCSSDDVKDDRKELRYNLSRRNYILGELHLEDWIDLGLINTQNTQQNIQSAFDEKILKSDYVVFIFGDEFGTNTMHEWDICIKNTKRKPIILLGLKITSTNTICAEGKRSKLGSRNVIVDCVYSNITEFEQKIVDVLIERQNKRKDKAIKIIEEHWKNFSRSDWQIIESKCVEIENRAKEYNVPISDSIIGIKQMVSRLSVAKVMSATIKTQMHINPRSSKVADCSKEKK